MKPALGALCALAFCAVTRAAEPAATTGPGHLDLYYTQKSTLKLDDTNPLGGGQSSFSGKGYGLRTFLRAGEIVAFEGEYGKTNLGDNAGGPAEKVTATRLGAGLASANSSGVFVQWLNLKTSKSVGDDNRPGWGLHGRLAADLTAKVHVFGDAGYQQYKDNSFKAKGPEYSAGAVITAGQGTEMLLDYRISSLKTYDEPYPLTLKSSDLRIGFRVKFGN